MHSVDHSRCSCGASSCPAPGKHPRVRWEEYQHRLPTVDEVRAWWQRWPTANVGVVTGAVSGLVVLDVDPRHRGDDELAALERRHGPLPPTPEVLTGGSGVHHYFRHPGRLTPSGPIAAGLDLQGDGGIAVAPPSVHVSGHRYEWEPHGAVGAPADLPAWLLESGSSDGRRRVRPSVAARSSEEQREFADLWLELGVDLEPGDRYYGCPLHDDEHPSLHVDAQGCRWYCFGCRRGGGPGRLAAVVRARGPAPLRDRRNRRRAAPPPSSWLQWPTLQPGGSQEVVGEGAHQAALDTVAGGRTWHGPAHRLVVAQLLREPDNRHDPAAVRVEVGGLRVGYLPRDDARRFHGAIAQLAAVGRPATARAWITGGWVRGPRDRGSFGIVVDVDPRLVALEADSPFLPQVEELAIVVTDRGALRELLGDRGHVGQVATLLEASGGGLEVWIDQLVMGSLEPRDAALFAPLVRDVVRAGYPATCRVTVERVGPEIVARVALPLPGTV